MSKAQAEPVAFEVWAKAMQGEFDGFLQETWESMNGARQGHWIEDTEEGMRRARDRLGQVAYEKLLQLRLEQAQALQRDVIGLDVVDADLEMVEARAVERLDPVLAEVVAVRDQRDEHPPLADVFDDLVELRIH